MGRRTKRSTWYVCFFDDSKMSPHRVAFPKAQSFIKCLRVAMIKQADRPHLTYVVVNGITKERVPVRRWAKEIRSNG